MIMADETTGRLGWLDAVRGVAALTVVFQHGFERVYQPFVWLTDNALNLGRAAVTAFFLVSGFVIPLSLERTGSLRGFWINRFFRLFPLYWLSLFATIFGFHDVPRGSSFDRTNIVHVLANCTMIEEFIGFPRALPVYWTLTVEMMFYFALSALFFLRWHTKTLQVLIGCCVFVTVSGVIVPLVVGRPIVPVGYKVFYAASAFFGTLLYRYSKQVASLRDVWIGGGALVITGAGIYFMQHVILHSDPVVGPWTIPVSWAVGWGSFIAMFLLRDRYRPSRAMSFIGAVSYSLYLLHFLFILPIERALGYVWCVPALLVVSIAVAAVTYRTIELPMQALGRRVQRRLVPKPEPDGGARA
jgi:peptidoglycan/LPS O-acetylase OafA/YrhL